jgi:DNA-binding GntR family transcriptional regulator
MSGDVYREIRTRISRGEFLGGDALREEDLAHRLGVSRTPIREALNRLEAEGIVERRSNRRVHLREMDAHQVVDIFAVRAILEPAAARLAAERADGAFVESLRILVDRMEVARLTRPPDLKAYRQANEAFHWAILARSANPTLDSTVRMVARRPIVGPTFNGWSSEELQRSQAHHKELLAAFECRDADWACAIMQSHMLAARAAFVRLTSSDAKRSEGSNGKLPTRLRLRK